MISIYHPFRYTILYRSWLQFTCCFIVFYLLYSLWYIIQRVNIIFISCNNEWGKVFPPTAWIRLHAFWSFVCNILYLQNAHSHTHTCTSTHAHAHAHNEIYSHQGTHNLVIKPSHHLNQNITDNTYCPHRMKIVCKFLSGLKMNEIYLNSSKFIQLHLSNNYFRFLGTINLCVWSFYYQKVPLCIADELKLFHPFRTIQFI